MMLVTPKAKLLGILVLEWPNMSLFVDCLVRITVWMCLICPNCISYIPYCKGHVLT